MGVISQLYKFSNFVFSLKGLFSPNLENSNSFRKFFKKAFLELYSPGWNVTAGKGNSLMPLVSTVVVTYFSLNPSIVLYKKYVATPNPAMTMIVHMILVDLDWVLLTYENPWIDVEEKKSFTSLQRPLILN